jgi:hypothetical protein
MEEAQLGQAAVQEQQELQGADLGAAHAEGGGAGLFDEALPPASQLDPSVLAELPEELRREIQQAYGEGPTCADLHVLVC